MGLVTVRDSIVTSRGNFSQTGAIQVLDSVDNHIVANSFKSHPVRVYEDGVSPSQPEAKCDWARGGCAGAKSHPFKSLFPSLRGRGKSNLAGGERRLGQGQV